MAVLVTGGAGYVGSVTVEHLLARGEEIVVLDNLSRAGAPPCLVADTAKAKTLLRWWPRCSTLTTMVRSAWEWLQAHPHGYSTPGEKQAQVALM